jgi:hypothetical protein
MKRAIIGASVAALIAIPAWAIATGDHHGMRGPQTRAEVEVRVKEHFAEVDKNKDGAITKEEADSFRTAKRAEMHDKRFEMMDANKDGQISREEFDAPRGDKGDKGHRMGGMHHRGMGMMRDHGDMFAKADANSDGKVTLSEATGKALEMFDRADTNKDGTVTPEERRAAMKAWFEARRAKAS